MITVTLMISGSITITEEAYWAKTFLSQVRKSNRNMHEFKRVLYFIS